jgi:hypothetical protein
MAPQQQAAGIYTGPSILDILPAEMLSNICNRIEGTSVVKFLGKENSGVKIVNSDLDAFAATCRDAYAFVISLRRPILDRTLPIMICSTGIKDGFFNPAITTFEFPFSDTRTEAFIEFSKRDVHLDNARFITLGEPTTGRIRMPRGDPQSAYIEMQMMKVLFELHNYKKLEKVVVTLPNGLNDMGNLKLTSWINFWFENFLEERSKKKYRGYTIPKFEFRGFGLGPPALYKPEEAPWVGEWTVEQGWTGGVKNEHSVEMLRKAELKKRTREAKITAEGDLSWWPRKIRKRARHC